MWNVNHLTEEKERCHRTNHVRFNEIDAFDGPIIVTARFHNRNEQMEGKIRMYKSALQSEISNSPTGTIDNSMVTAGFITTKPIASVKPKITSEGSFPKIFLI